MYKAIRNIEVTFKNNKVKEMTFIVFDNAMDNARAKLTREVKHLASNPKVTKITNVSEYFETI